ncbi:MAG TPA: SAM-dependent methyltransferase, partial [Candidatus Marinimicrobia bacterium]|nr:SAM-dependent methyltransferase [Candidatus Neomarinimicrobiota bacterium]
QETERVLKPKGVLAIWSYRLHTITPEIDRIVLKYYDEILGSYWPPERKMVDQDYAEIQFP